MTNSNGIKDGNAAGKKRMLNSHQKKSDNRNHIIEVTSGSELANQSPDLNYQLNNKFKESGHEQEESDF